MPVHGMGKLQVVVFLQGFHNCFVLHDRICQMGQLFLQLIAGIHGPDRVQQGHEHRITHGAEKQLVKFPVLPGKSAALFPADAHLRYDLPHLFDILLPDAVKCLAHIAQLQRFSDVEHLADLLLILRQAEEERVLENEIHREFPHFRSPPRAGLHHAHQLHAFDSLPDHIAADPDFPGKLRLAGKQIPGLHLVAQNIVMDFPEGCDAVNRFSFRKIIENSTAGSKQVEVEEKRIEKDITEPFTDVEIICVADHVTIKEAENGICHLAYTEDAYTQYTVAVEQGTLKITQEDTDISWDWKNLKNTLSQLLDKGFTQLGAAMENSHDLILTLPAGAYGKINVTNVSGGLEVGENISAEEVNLAAVSGNVTAEGLTSVRSMNAATTSGKVELRSMKLTGDINAATVSGGIILENIETPGKVSLATTSGKMELIESVIGKGEIDGVSGNILFTNFDADTMDIELVSGSMKGTIRAPKEFQVETTSGDVSVPNGNGGIWKIETTSGDVKIDLQ